MVIFGVIVKASNSIIRSYASIKKREGDLTGFDNTSENYFCRMIRVTCG